MQETTGDVGLIPGLGTSPGEGNGNPLRYPCLKSPMDRGAWSVTARGVAESDTTEGLSAAQIHLNASLICLCLTLSEASLLSLRAFSVHWFALFTAALHRSPHLCRLVPLMCNYVTYGVVKLQRIEILSEADCNGEGLPWLNTLEAVCPSSAAGCRSLTRVTQPPELQFCRLQRSFPFLFPGGCHWPQGTLPPCSYPVDKS